jgi:hypothetical protein
MGALHSRTIEKRMAAAKTVKMSLLLRIIYYASFDSLTGHL